MERQRALSWLTDGRVLIVCGVCLLAGFVLGMLIFGSPWHLPPAWGDIPTWVTAIATMGLLIGAIITARYAIKAFRKQSEELEEQREINKLQAQDLEESLKERKRLRQVAEREQANDVGFAWWPASHVLIMKPPPQLPPGTSGHPQAVAHVDTSGMSVLIVGNESRRRILAAACRIEPSEGTGLTLAAEQIGQLADVPIEPHRAMLNNPADGKTTPLIRAGSRYGFLVRFDLKKNPDTRLAARFTDDAGLHWQINQDLHLERLRVAIGDKGMARSAPHVVRMRRPDKSRPTYPAPCRATSPPRSPP